MAIATKVIVEQKGSNYVVHDTKSGLSYKLKGYGALKGKITFRDDIDLTKPIAEQVTQIELSHKKAAQKISKAVA